MAVFIKPKLIVGLGNPGADYERTRHNIGKRVIEKIRSCSAHPAGIQFFTTEGFMNTSGVEVSRFMAYKNIQPQEVLVVSDDFELPLGRMRIRLGGSDGGHNGLKSVIEHLKTQDVPRLRIGIGPVPEGLDPAQFVLKKFSKVEEKQLEGVIDKVEKAIDQCVAEGIEPAMNQFNGMAL